MAKESGPIVLKWREAPSTEGDNPSCLRFLFQLSLIAILVFVLGLFLTRNCASLIAKLGIQAVPKIILVSYDGFRWDYVQKNHDHTPNFNWLIKNGVHAVEGLKNTFITITAPNHYGLVTGLYEGSHGIIANDFFNPKLGKRFEYFETRWKTDPRFFGGEPIWTTNDRSGSGRASGCMMWVGCDVLIDGHRPLHFVSFDANLDWRLRVDSLIAWFNNPRRPINFGLLYIEQPDKTGHEFGPVSPQTQQMVRKLDNLTGYLLNQLHRAGLDQEVNLIFTADHGMASVPWSNVINIDKYVDPSWYKVYGGSPNWNVLPVKGKTDEIYRRLKDVKRMRIFRKSQIPASYHYSDSPSVMPLQFYSDLYWRLAHSVPSKEDNIRPYREGNPNRIVGEHGYNNSFPDMHPYFIAHGPAFREGYKIQQFSNLDLYPLMCRILGIRPAPNNGSLTRVKRLLKPSPVQTPKSAFADLNLDLAAMTFLAIACAILMSLAALTVRLRSNQSNDIYAVDTIPCNDQQNDNDKICLL